MVRERITPFTFSLIIMTVNITGCAQAAVFDHRGTNTMDTKKIEAVLKKHSGDLLNIPGIAGTAIGLCDETPCIKVYVLKKTPELDEKIPGELEGYTVVIEETGEFKPLPGEEPE
ncbi:MAG: hypothetical protein OEW04_07345 [Nitrospirota bacterium]|nr:hypothetical protein [Nitrospirota bacterium]